MAGQVLQFTNNYALGGGAFLLLNSSLHEADADVIFSNNTALDQGGSLYLFSTFYLVQMWPSLIAHDYSANNKGGAIYIESGITAASMLYGGNEQTSCFYHNFAKL